MKTIIIRVKWLDDTRIYRDLEIGSDESLFSLGKAILQSFGDGVKHLFGFGDNPKDFFRSLKKYSLRYDNYPFEDWAFRDKEDGDVEKIKIADVPFFQKPKDKMSFLYDFGHFWSFEATFVGYGSGQGISGDKYFAIRKKKGEYPKNWEM